MSTINIRITEKLYQKLKKRGKPSEVASQLLTNYVACREWGRFSYTDYGSSSTMEGVSWT